LMSTDGHAWRWLGATPLLRIAERGPLVDTRSEALKADSGQVHLRPARAATHPPPIALAMYPASDTDGDGVVTQSRVLLTGRTTRRVQVRLDLGADVAVHRVG
jgi:hypothetical protein